MKKLFSLWRHTCVNLCNSKGVNNIAVIERLCAIKSHFISFAALSYSKLHSSAIMAEKHVTAHVDDSVSEHVEACVSGVESVDGSNLDNAAVCTLPLARATNSKHGQSAKVSDAATVDKSMLDVGYEHAELAVLKSQLDMDNPVQNVSVIKHIDQSDKATGDGVSNKLDVERCTSPGDKKSDGASNLSRRAQKRLRRRQLIQKNRQDKKMKKRLAAEDAELIKQEFLNETEYYQHNGLRKVYPYYYTFATFAKGRWVGRSLLDVFMEEFRHDTQENYKRAITEGRVKISGKPATAEHILKDCDYIENAIHRHELPVTAEPIPIIHEDKDVVVVNKPSSIPIHPCGRYRHNTMTFILAKEYGYHNLRGVYRLDRLTSGVLIFCKTQRRANIIQRHVRERLVQKEYVCKVVGDFPSERVECDMQLEVLSHKLGVFKVSSGGKEAHTSFQRINFDGKCSIVKCFPHTGRTHQIRVHLQYLGYPIVNDPIYNTPIWGPDIGKAGIYHKTEEQLIADLLDHHTAEKHIDVYLPDSASAEQQVDGGMHSENKQQQTHMASLETASNGDSSVRQDTIVVNVERTGGVSEKMETGVVSDGRADISGHGGVLSLLSKVDQQEELSHQAICENQNEVNDQEKTGCSLSGSCFISKVSNDNLCGGAMEGKDNNITVDDVNTSCGVVRNPSESENYLCVEKNAKRPRIDAGQNVEMTKTASKKSGVVVLADFVPAKLVHDIHCPQCHIVYKDPTQDELQLYLHALSYKGPDWHYETELPEWAKT